MPNTSSNLVCDPQMIRYKVISGMGNLRQMADFRQNESSSSPKKNLSAKKKCNKKKSVKKIAVKTVRGA